MRLRQWIVEASERLRAGRDLGRSVLNLSWTRSTSTTFCGLPEDVLVCILSHCSLRDLISCMSVCRLLGTVVRTNGSLLRYKTLLAANGMVDGPTDYPGKLQMLLEYVAASGRGTFVSTNARYKFPINAGNDGLTMSLSFSSCISYIVTKRLEGVAEVYAPPEVPGRRIMRHWSVALDTFPGESNRAVAVDPAQNLLLVFQKERPSESEWDVAVHIRSLHDPWTPHPDAVLPIVHTAPSLLVFSSVSEIQIHRQIVAWMQYSDDTGIGSQIEIWDWQAGRMIWRHQFGQEVSFTLLDVDHIVVTSNGWLDLRVFRYDPSSDPTVDILRLKLPDPLLSQTTRRLAFLILLRTLLSGQTRT
ncbi:hypothetical protein L227DRAFT_153410 [Lentinus tigrinus ALCF2SS1-6]|uniref:F-box domain-containing protein n=1 Tax=Lentinus tigrinus ALCF2SS1-6 TaxID=1328759 RepID=A0A5C2S6Y9_9APHY|nr:hypothetical protein L227DRAFT_153410 [Lentinus tigrinus ALCF2SS1-6]